MLAVSQVKGRHRIPVIRRIRQRGTGSIADPPREGEPAEALGAVQPVLDGVAPVVGNVSVVEAQRLSGGSALRYAEWGDLICRPASTRYLYGSSAPCSFRPPHDPPGG
jgi:hypothetical protein